MDKTRTILQRYRGLTGVNLYTTVVNRGIIRGMTEVETQQKPQITEVTPFNRDTQRDTPGMKHQADKKADKPLTPKQRAFVKHRIDNPKASGTQSALAVYDTTDPVTASVIAYENLRKPQILTELAKYSHTAEITLVDVMNVSREYAKTGTREGASYASVAVQTANSVLDRLHGKALQRSEQRSEVVTLNIDLTGVSG